MFKFQRKLKTNFTKKKYFLKLQNVEKLRIISLNFILNQFWLELEITFIKLERKTHILELKFCLKFKVKRKLQTIKIFSNTKFINI